MPHKEAEIVWDESFEPPIPDPQSLSAAQIGAKQMPGCSGQRHLLVGIVMLLLGESVAARQRSNVVLNNPLGQLSYSIQSVAAKVSPAIVQIEILGYIHPDDDKGDDQDRIDTHIVTRTNS